MRGAAFLQRERFTQTILLWIITYIMLRNFPDLDYASRALRKRRKQQKLGCGLTKICTYQQRHVALKKAIAALTLCLFCCLCVTTLQIFNRLFRHLD